MSINEQDIILHIKNSVDSYVENCYKVTNDEIEKLRDFIKQEFDTFIEKCGVKEELKSESLGKENYRFSVNYAFKRFITCNIDVLEAMHKIYKRYANGAVKI